MAVHHKTDKSPKLQTCACFLHQKAYSMSSRPAPHPAVNEDSHGLLRFNSPGSGECVTRYSDTPLDYLGNPAATDEPGPVREIEPERHPKSPETGRSAAENPLIYRVIAGKTACSSRFDLNGRGYPPRRPGKKNCLMITCNRLRPVDENDPSDRIVGSQRCSLDRVFRGDAADHFFSRISTNGRRHD